MPLQADTEGGQVGLAGHVQQHEMWVWPVGHYEAVTGDLDAGVARLYRLLGTW